MNISNINPIGSGMQNITKHVKEDKEVNEFEKKLEEAKNNKDDEALKEACKSFESYFIKKIFSEMRSTVQYSKFTPKSKGEKIFTDMLDDEYAKKGVEGDGIGLSKMLYEQLKK